MFFGKKTHHNSTLYTLQTQLIPRFFFVLILNSHFLAIFQLFATGPNYVLKGCQWQQIPIDKDECGAPEIYYIIIYKAFKFWVKYGCFDKIFEASVLDLSVLHGDDTCTTAKKGAII